MTNSSYSLETVVIMSEFGCTKTLIPLLTESVFVTTTADKQDTLWTIDYSEYNPYKPYFSQPKYKFYKTNVTGKIYDRNSIDRFPTFLNGDSIIEIKLPRKVLCISEPYYFLKSLSFVITEKGRIVNIEQDCGNFNWDYCPFYLIDLITKVSQFGIVKPGEIKGKPVNTKWTIKVDMCDTK